MYTFQRLCLRSRAKYQRVFCFRAEYIHFGIPLVMFQLAMQNFCESCINSSLLREVASLNCYQNRMSLCHPDVRSCSQGTAHEAPALPFPNHREITHPPPYHSCPESREKKTKRWALAGTRSMPQGQRPQASWNCPSVSWSTANTMLATRVCSHSEHDVCQMPGHTLACRKPLF